MFNQPLSRLVGIASLLWAITYAAQVEAESPPAPSDAAVAAQHGTVPVSTGAPGKPDGVEWTVGSSKTAIAGSTMELELGNVFFEAWDWNAAIEKYQKAAESPDEKIAAAARERLALALAHRDAQPLGLRQWLPSPFSHWWLLDYAILALVLLIILVPVLRVILALWRTLMRIVKPGKSKANWRIVLNGSAENREQSLVLDELVITLDKLKVLRRDFAGREIAALGGSFREGSFFYPISLTALVEPGVTVRGVDIGRVAAFLQAVKEYYSYKLEVRVDRHAGSAYVFASLKWGAYVEQVWQIPAIGCLTALGFREIGRQLAYDICGSRMVRQ